MGRQSQEPKGGREKWLWTTLLLTFICPLVSSLADTPPSEPPTEWIDPATGHRVVRLSREPGSASLYFHQNAYSVDGQRLVITTPSGISTIDLKSHKIEQVVEGKVRVLMTGRKTGAIYCVRDDSVYTTDLDTRATRTVAKIPSYLRQDNSFAINCDETVLVGLAVDPQGKAEPRKLPANNSGGRLSARWAQGLPMVLFTIDLRSGELKKIHHQNDWMNQLQCSPTDPGQIVFCHEGPWQFNHRTLDDSHGRLGLDEDPCTEMDMDIAGYELEPDGKTIWYDLQTPRGTVFWLAGYNLETRERTWTTWNAMNGQCITTYRLTEHSLWATVVVQQRGLSRQRSMDHSISFAGKIAADRLAGAGREADQNRVLEVGATGGSVEAQLLA